MQALGYSWHDVEDALGLPRGYIDVAEIPAAEKLRILAREIEPLDQAAIDRVSEGDLRFAGERLQFPDAAGADLLDDIAEVIGRQDEHSIQPRSAFLRALAEQIEREMPS